MKKKESKITANSNILNIQSDKSFQILKLALDEIKENYGVGSEEIFNLIGKKPFSKETLIPASIFEADGLSALEAVCKYLKEELDLNYSKIASVLSRDSRTIWTTYNIACKKRKERLPAKESKFFIPASIFTDRKLSVLEAIVGYLRDKFRLRYTEIAALLNRDERNMWSVYNRYKKKNGK
ncbi:hypothetical protein HYU09_02400 [Candidatus Woesearchaeota archaeon]|nr:hypothetical protein [Candidatus Woesearchaeota archaeon]